MGHAVEDMEGDVDEVRHTYTRGHTQDKHKHTHTHTHTHVDARKINTQTHAWTPRRSAVCKRHVPCLERAYKGCVRVCVCVRVFCRMMISSTTQTSPRRESLGRGVAMQRSLKRNTWMTTLRMR